MARDKNTDPLRRAGKHSDNTRDRYGHEHAEQLPQQRNGQKNVNGNKHSDGNKSHEWPHHYEGQRGIH